MAGGRPRKPIAEKRLAGTYRADRDSVQERNERQIQAVLPRKRLRIAKDITNPEVRKAYRDHINLLRSLGAGAEQSADSPLLEYAYLNLQIAWECRKVMDEMSVLDDGYSAVYQKCVYAFSQYNKIVKDFYLTPNARVKLNLDALTAAEKRMNIESGEQKKNVVQRLLDQKKS